MAVEMPGFAELTELRKRGMPYWWLWAANCPLCGQHCLVAQEERQNDTIVMRRLSDDEARAIVADDIWPADFDKYETLLRIGARQERQFRFMNPVEQLPYILDLARERPGISVEDLASLFNLEPPMALELARRAACESDVSITFPGAATID
jgi:hypothetical protein